MASTLAWPSWWCRPARSATRRPRTRTPPLPERGRRWGNGLEGKAAAITVMGRHATWAGGAQWAVSRGCSVSRGFSEQGGAQWEGYSTLTNLSAMKTLTMAKIVHMYPKPWWKISNKDCNHNWGERTCHATHARLHPTQTQHRHECQQWCNPTFAAQPTT